METKLNPALKSWLAFANQKMSELVTLGTALVSGRTTVEAALVASSAAAEARRRSPRLPRQEPAQAPVPRASAIR